MAGFFQSQTQLPLDSMSDLKDTSESSRALQMDEDLQFFQRTLSIQYVARWVVFILLIAACLGLFGTGFLSNRTIKQAGMELQYEYFLRRESKTEIVLHQNESEAFTVIRFPTSYLKHFTIEKTIPEPHFTGIENGYTNYVFQTSGASTVRLFISPEDFGSVSGDMLINDRHFHLSHFIYP
jgi:hypothetical protein